MSSTMIAAPTMLSNISTISLSFSHLPPTVFQDLHDFDTNEALNIIETYLRTTNNSTPLLLATDATQFNASATNDTADTKAMCDLKHIQDAYMPVHGYLSLVVCLFGTLTNLLNILVLSHKDMRVRTIYSPLHTGNPINLILTGIAVADILVMTEYIPFSAHMYLLTDRAEEEKFSWGWGVFMWMHVNFSIVIHTVSIWLTLSLAVWRFIMIRFATLAVGWCTLKRCKVIIIMGYVIPIMLGIPNFLATEILPTERNNGTLYMLRWSKLAEYHDAFLYRFTVWLYSFFLKLAPCVVLTILTGLLIRALYKAEENSNRLHNRNNTIKSQAESKDGDSHHTTLHLVTPKGTQKAVPSRRKKTTDRTTRLLVVILILFLITEFPQGVLGVLSAAIGQKFFLDCYTPLGELMDILALINCAINFILYCTMSRQFRVTFDKIFHLKALLHRMRRRGSRDMTYNLVALHDKAPGTRETLIPPQMCGKRSPSPGPK